MEASRIAPSDQVGIAFEIDFDGGTPVSVTRVWTNWGKDWYPSDRALSGHFMQGSAKHVATALAHLTGQYRADQADGQEPTASAKATMFKFCRRLVQCGVNRSFMNLSCFLPPDHDQASDRAPLHRGRRGIHPFFGRVFSLSDDTVALKQLPDQQETISLHFFKAGDDREVISPDRLIETSRHITDPKTIAKIYLEFCKPMRTPRGASEKGTRQARKAKQPAVNHPPSDGTGDRRCEEAAKYSSLLVGRFSEIVGRNEFKSRLAKFVARSHGGIFLLSGPPGGGKTALLAHISSWATGLSRRTAVCSYFFRQGSLLSSHSLGLQVLVRGLEGIAQTSVACVSHEPVVLGHALSNLLLDISDRCAKGDGRVIIVVDALNESDNAAGFLSALPKDWPDRVFLVISARDEVDFAMLRDPRVSHRVESYSLDPRAEWNRSDCSAYVRRLLPAISRRSADRLARLAQGNFEFVHIVAGIPTVVPHDDDHLESFFRDAVTHGRDTLRSLYDYWWLMLRERVLTSTPRLWEDVLTCLGVMTAAGEPVTDRQVMAFAGISRGRHDAVLRQIGQFLLVHPLADHGNPIRMIYHDTFRSFLCEQFASDLPRYHGMIAASYLSDQHPLLPERLDAYGISHLLTHISRSDHKQLYTRVATPQYFLAKFSARGSALALRNDFEASIACAADQGDFFAIIRHTLLWRHFEHLSSDLESTARAMLDVREGDTTRPLAFLNECRNPNKRALVNAEYVRRWIEAAPTLARDHGNRLLASVKEISPKVVEEIAVELSTVDSSLAIEIAQTLPEPDLIFDLTTREEFPSPGRALYRVFSAVARRSRAAAVSLARTIENKRSRAAAYWAIAAGTDSSMTRASLQSVKKAFHGVNQEEAGVWITRYASIKLSDIAPENRFDILTAIADDFHPCTLHVFRTSLFDESIEADAKRWQTFCRAKPQSVLAAYMRWRLAALGHRTHRVRASRRVGELFDELAAFHAIEDGPLSSDKAASLAGRGTSLVGQYYAIARAASKLYDRGEHESAIDLIRTAANSPDLRSDATCCGILFLLQVVIGWPGSLRGDIVRRAYDSIGRVQLAVHRADAAHAAGAIIGEAFSRAHPAGSRFLDDILDHSSVESYRKLVLVGALTCGPIEVCTMIATSPDAFGLRLSPASPKVLLKRRFLPETSFAVLTSLLRRLAVEERAVAVALADQMAESLITPWDASSSAEMRESLILAVAECLPDHFERLSQTLRIDRERIMAVTKAILQSDRRPRTNEDARFFRLQIERLHGLVLPAANQTKARIFCNQRDPQVGLVDPPPILDSHCRPSTDAATHSIVLGTVLQYYCEHLAGSVPAGSVHCQVLHHDIVSGAARHLLGTGWDQCVSFVRSTKGAAKQLRSLDDEEILLSLFRNTSTAPRNLAASLDVLRDQPALDEAVSLDATFLNNVIVEMSAAADPGTFLGELPELLRTARYPLDSISEFGLPGSSAWSDADVKQFYDILGNEPTRSADPLHRAGCIAWVLAHVANPRAFVDETLRYARAIESPAALLRVGDVLKQIDSSAAVQLFEWAADAAIRARDATAIVEVLASDPHVPDSLRDRLLLAAGGILDHNSHAAETVQYAAHISRTNVESALDVLARLSHPLSEAEKLIDSLATGLAVSSKELIHQWCNRISGLRCVGETAAGRFAKSLVFRAIATKSITSIDDVRQLLHETGDRAEALVALASHAGLDTRHTILREAEAEALGSTETFAAVRALRSIADLWLRDDRHQAIRILRLSVEAMRRHCNAFCMATDMAEAAAFCATLAPNDVQEIAPCIRQAVEQFPFGEDPLDKPYMEAWAWISNGCISSLYDWEIAAQDFRRVLPIMQNFANDSIHGSLVVTIVMGFSALHNARGAQHATSFAERLLLALPEEHRAPLAGEIVAYCLSKGSPVNDLVVPSGMLLTEVPEPHRSLVAALESFCSARGQIEAALARAVANRNCDRAATAAALATACTLAAGHDGTLPDRLRERLSLLTILLADGDHLCDAACALLLSPVPATRAIDQPADMIAHRLRHIVRAAFVVSTDKRRFLQNCRACVASTSSGSY